MQLLCTGYQYNYSASTSHAINLYRLAIELFCIVYQYDYSVKAIHAINLNRLRL